MSAMQPLPLSNDGLQLVHNLQTTAMEPDVATSELVHIAGVATSLYAAYERLRNAAEYTEQHLLLRAAIERFLRRSILMHGSTARLGHELVVELTQAGYLKNDTVSTQTIIKIDEFIAQYNQLATTITASHRISPDKARRWTLQVLSVCIEKLLVPHPKIDAFIDFAYKHYLYAIDRKYFPDVADEAFENALYCAVHRILIKSDIATIRFYMMAKTNQQDNTTLNFVALCKTVDKLFQSPLTNKLSRLIDRHGAPLRILREVTTAEVYPAHLIDNRSSLLAKVRAVAEDQYELVHRKLVKGVIRAIIFIFITKMLIGLAVEIPYDLMIIGTIAWLPLLINLFFPVLYMATAGWSIGKPAPQNTEAIAGYIDRILYQSEKPPLQYKIERRVTSSNLRSSFNIVYALTFVISFGLVMWILQQLKFSVVHIIIFFIFFSAVSFLRFRLIQTARELELMDNRQSLISAIGDFFYTPFIRLGMWLSDQYKQINVISVLLDYAIELPLKSSLRLLRQWVSFMRDKREEI